MRLQWQLRPQITSNLEHEDKFSCWAGNSSGQILCPLLPLSSSSRCVGRMYIWGQSLALAETSSPVSSTAAVWHGAMVGEVRRVPHGYTWLRWSWCHPSIQASARCKGRLCELVTFWSFLLWHIREDHISWSSQARFSSLISPVSYANWNSKILLCIEVRRATFAFRELMNFLIICEYCRFAY